MTCECDLRQRRWNPNTGFCETCKGAMPAYAGVVDAPNASQPERAPLAWEQVIEDLKERESSYTEESERASEDTLTSVYDELLNATVWAKLAIMQREPLVSPMHPQLLLVRFPYEHEGAVFVHSEGDRGRALVFTDFQNAEKKAREVKGTVYVASYAGSARTQRSAELASVLTREVADLTQERDEAMATVDRHHNTVVQLQKQLTSERAERTQLVADATASARATYELSRDVAYMQALKVELEIAKQESKRLSMSVAQPETASTNAVIVQESKHMTQLEAIIQIARGSRAPERESVRWTPAADVVAVALDAGLRAQRRLEEVRSALLSAGEVHDGRRHALAIIDRKDT